MLDLSYATGRWGFLRQALIGESAGAAELVAMLAEGRMEFVRLDQRYPRLLVEDAQTYCKVSAHGRDQWQSERRCRWIEGRHLL
jgi:hypothetical protein